MITLRNIILRRGPNILLEDINWTIYHKQHIGIIGANGCGKSSLFAMLLHQLQPDGGDFDMPRQLRLGHVAQETPALSKSALEFVLDGDVELRELEAQLTQAEHDNDGEKIGALHQRLSEIDGYSATARAAQLLDGLGFHYEEQQKPVSAFSGGWRVRLNLAHTLMSRADILLLDEPTNHLDLDAVLWLEQWLKKFPGTLLIISHDRDFLDSIVDHIAHIQNKNLKLYAGNYSAFEKQLAAFLMLQQAAYEKQQRQISHLQSFVDRFRAKASKARQAQSRMKALDRMEIVSAVQVNSPFQFHFKEPKNVPTPLVALEDVSIGYGDQIILPHINFSIAPKDRIGLLGPNGAGKSTFIKLLANQHQALGGSFTAGTGLKIGYFAQHQIDHLHLTDSPLQHLKKLAPTTREVELRSFLGSFGFSGNRVLEAVENFSGGEKSRLALALLIWQQPNLLLLDEPTNHLDMEMRNALSMALQEYEGAMIIVSHDRFLVRSTVDQLMIIAAGKLTPFEGDLDDYQEWLMNFRRQNNASTVAKTSVSRKEQRQQNALERDQRRPLLQKVKKLETELDKLQKQVTNLELILADEKLYEDANKTQLQDYLLKQATLKKQLETVELDWLAATEAAAKDS
ncbi:MAG: ATP-binding cassette domain-containing protein [Pseudomonadota bacterium]